MTDLIPPSELFAIAQRIAAYFNDHPRDREADPLVDQIARDAQRVLADLDTLRQRVRVAQLWLAGKAYAPHVYETPRRDRQ